MGINNFKDTKAVKQPIAEPTAKAPAKIPRKLLSDRKNASALKPVLDCSVPYFSTDLQHTRHATSLVNNALNRSTTHGAISLVNNALNRSTTHEARN